MANISDVTVKISLTNCAKEFKAFLALVEKDAYYNLCKCDNFDIDENNCAKIEGSAEGRWSYNTNLEGYFPEVEITEKSTSWLSVDAVEAYKNLLKAIIDNNGKVEIDFTEIEPSMCFIGTGGLAIIKGKNGEIEVSKGYEEYDYNLENLMKYCDCDEDYAREYMGIDENGNEL